LSYLSPSSAYRFLKYKLAEVYEEREAATILDYFFQDFFSMNHPSRIDSWPMADDAKKCEALGDRLINREPYQYVLGKSNFYGYDFKVNQSVLIPRAETEELVYLVLKDLQDSRQQLDVLDIGSGSGCIAITLKLKKPQLRLFAVEHSLDALNVSRINARRLDASIQFLRLDFTDQEMWTSLCKMDIIVSNPPYITHDEKGQMSKSTLRYEPEEALFVENDPMIFYRRIAEFGESFLKDGGCIYVEINEFRAVDTIKIFQDYGYRLIELHHDLQQRPRMLKILK